MVANCRALRDATSGSESLQADNWWKIREWVGRAGQVHICLSYCSRSSISLKCRHKMLGKRNPPQSFRYLHQINKRSPCHPQEKQISAQIRGKNHQQQNKTKVFCSFQPSIDQKTFLKIISQTYLQRQDYIFPIWEWSSCLASPSTKQTPSLPSLPIFIWAEVMTCDQPKAEKHRPKEGFCLPFPTFQHPIHKLKTFSLSSHKPLQLRKALPSLVVLLGTPLSSCSASTTSL